MAVRQAVSEMRAAARTAPANNRFIILTLACGVLRVNRDQVRCRERGPRTRFEGRPYHRWGNIHVPLAVYCNPERTGVRNANKARQVVSTFAIPFGRPSGK